MARKDKARPVFEDIMSGLGQALAHAKGEDVPGIVVHVPETLDVAAIRERTGLAQPAFAATIGVKVGTLRNWEQNRREPEGPARVLLAMVDRRPQIVTEILGQSPANDHPGSATDTGRTAEVA